MPANPRGSIVLPSRPIDIGNGCMMSGRKPGIIVYIKAGSGRLVREFTRFCDVAGIDAMPVQSAGDRPDAYECIGSIESLERLTGHPAVRDWHFIVGVRVPLTAAGSGAESVRSEQARRESRRPWVEREARAERERIAKLPKAERAGLELADTIDRPTGPQGAEEAANFGRVAAAWKEARR